MKKTTIMTFLMIILAALFAVAPAFADKPNYVVTCVGEDLTVGKWPGKLQEKLNGFSGASFTVLDRAIAGKSPFDFAQLDLSWRDTNPDIICILLGSTDIYFFWIEHNLNDGRTYETAQWTQEVVNRGWEYREKHPLIVLSLIPPMNNGDCTYFVRVYNDYLKANAYHIDALVTANFDDFWNPSTVSPLTQFLSGERGLTDEGQQMLANNFYQAIMGLVGVANRDASGDKDSLYW